MKMRMIDVIRKSSDRNIEQIIGAVVAMRADGLSEEEALNIEYVELLRVLRSEVEVDYKPTNADRIRSMSDEELAEWIHNISQDYDEEQEPTVSIYNLDTKKDMELHDSYGDLLNWLQSEVEE